MNEITKKKLLSRLKRAEGQMAAIRRMVEADEYCVDVLLQIAAARGALAKAGQVLLGSHIETCVSKAFASGDEQVQQQSICELMEIFERYGGISR